MDSGSGIDTQPTVADGYLQLLAAHGVDYFFGNAGTDFPPIIEALRSIGYQRFLSAEVLPLPDSLTAAKHVADGHNATLPQAALAKSPKPSTEMFTASSNGLQRKDEAMCAR